MVGKRDISNFTSIQISRESKVRLRSLALTPRESYENILLRLLDAKLGGRELFYNIRSLSFPDCSLDCVVDWGSDVENIMFLDGNNVRKFRVPVSGVEGWSEFREAIMGLGNLINILAILEFDEEIRAGDLVLKRIS